MIIINNTAVSYDPTFLTAAQNNAINSVILTGDHLLNACNIIRAAHGENAQTFVCGKLVTFDNSDTQKQIQDNFGEYAEKYANSVKAGTVSAWEYALTVVGFTDRCIP